MIYVGRFNVLQDTLRSDELQKIRTACLVCDSIRLHRLPRQRQDFVAIKLVVRSRRFDFLELIADQAERFGTRGFELVLRAFEIPPGLAYCRGIFSWVEKWQADRNADIELADCLARFVVSLRLNIECRIGEPLALRELKAESFGLNPVLSSLHFRSRAQGHSLQRLQ